MSTTLQSPKIFYLVHVGWIWGNHFLDHLVKIHQVFPLIPPFFVVGLRRLLVQNHRVMCGATVFRCCVVAGETPAKKTDKLWLNQSSDVC